MTFNWKKLCFSTLSLTCHTSTLHWTAYFENTLLKIYNLKIHLWSIQLAEKNLNFSTLTYQQCIELQILKKRLVKNTLFKNTLSKHPIGREETFFSTLSHQHCTRSHFRSWAALFKVQKQVFFFLIEKTLSFQNLI